MQVEFESIGAKIAERIESMTVSDDELGLVKYIQITNNPDKVLLANLDQRVGVVPQNVRKVVDFIGELLPHIAKETEDYKSHSKLIDEAKERFEVLKAKIISEIERMKHSFMVLHHYDFPITDFFEGFSDGLIQDDNELRRRIKAISSYIFLKNKSGFLSNLNIEKLSKDIKNTKSSIKACIGKFVSGMTAGLFNSFDAVSLETLPLSIKDEICVKNGGVSSSLSSFCVMTRSGQLQQFSLAPNKSEPGFQFSLDYEKKIEIGSNVLSNSYSIASYSPTGTFLAVSSFDSKAIRVLESFNGEELLIWPRTSSSYLISTLWISDRVFLAGYLDNSIKGFVIPSQVFKQLKFPIPIPKHQISQNDIEHYNSHAFSCQFGPSGFSMGGIWSMIQVSSPKLVAFGSGSGHVILAKLSKAVYSKYIAIGKHKREIGSDTQSPEIIWQTKITNSRIYSLAFGPNNRIILAGASSSKVYFISESDGVLLTDLLVDGGPHVYGIALNPSELSVVITTSSSLEIIFKNTNKSTWSSASLKSAKLRGCPTSAVVNWNKGFVVFGESQAVFLVKLLRE